MLLGLALLLAYLLGSLSGSLLLGRVEGVDIRQHGSGNAGGTNAFRARGWRFALGVVLIDIGKGFLAVQLAIWLLEGSASQEAGLYAAGLAATLGHVFPIWHGFRGGKGAATAIGVLLALWPLSLPPLLGVWLVVLLSTGYVGLATVLGALVLVPLAWLDPAADNTSRMSFAIACALFIAWTHRSNLQRLHAGTEHCFERARVFHRWLRRR